MRLRLVEDRDLNSLLAVSLATGFAGADAAHLYEDGKLMGLIYSAPYARLEPSLALVVEDEGGVCGFAVGAIDTQAWEMRLEREWAGTAGSLSETNRPSILLDGGSAPLRDDPRP
jgi:hypothetical protein